MITKRIRSVVFQQQITGSIASEISDQVDNADLLKPSRSLVDDLNSIRSQLRRVINVDTSWVEAPATDLHDIHSKFTGSLSVNALSASNAFVGGDLTVAGNFNVLGSVTAISTKNASIGDAFIYLNTGSLGVTDSGVILGKANGNSSDVIVGNVGGDGTIVFATKDMQAGTASTIVDATLAPIKSVDVQLGSGQVNSSIVGRLSASANGIALTSNTDLTLSAYSTDFKLATQQEAAIWSGDQTLVGFLNQVAGSSYSYYRKGTISCENVNVNGELDISSIGSLRAGWSAERDLDVYLNGVLLQSDDFSVINDHTLLFDNLSQFKPTDRITVIVKNSNGAPIGANNDPPPAVIMGGDVINDSNSSSVVKIRNRAISSQAPTDGQIYVWNAANNEWIPNNITANSYTPGQIIQVQMLSFDDISQSASTTVDSTTYQTVASLNYTPVSSNSYIIVEYCTKYSVAGFGGDSAYSQITVDGNQITEGYQAWQTSGGGGTRSGTIFPLMGRFTNSTLSNKSILIQAKKDMQLDDDVTVFGDVGTWLKITEIAK